MLQLRNWIKCFWTSNFVEKNLPCRTLKRKWVSQKQWNLQSSWLVPCQRWKWWYQKRNHCQWTRFVLGFTVYRLFDLFWRHLSQNLRCFQIQWCASCQNHWLGTATWWRLSLDHWEYMGLWLGRKWLWKSLVSWWHRFRLLWSRFGCLSWSFEGLLRATKQKIVGPSRFWVNFLYGIIWFLYGRG